MSLQPVGERGCCSAIQDYLINAGRNARGNSSRHSCLVLYLQTTICEMIRPFQCRVGNARRREAGDVNEPKQLRSQDSCVRRRYLGQPSVPKERDAARPGIFRSLVSE